MYIKSYAKINLGLNICGKNQDGYHELDMVVLPLKLCDVIEVRKTSNNDTYIVCDDLPELSGQYNLVTRILNEGRKHLGIKGHYDISIHKEIPTRAGLGGGSSNAGAILRYVLQAENLHPDKKDVIDVARSVGADVPFFLETKPSRVQGIGEIVKPISVKNHFYVLLIKPLVGLSTRMVYETYDETGGEVANIEGLIENLSSGNNQELAKCVGNALERPAVALLPEIGEIINQIKECGLEIVKMTGSGSCIYALSTDKHLIKRAAKLFKKSDCEVIITETL